MFSVTPVFFANYSATEKILINQGGTWSSKTFSIIQLFFTYAKDKPGMIFTVTGESIPNLKKGAYRDAQNIYASNQELQQHIEFWNQSERIIYFKNGSLIEFVSNLNEQSAKNGKRDYLFVNEGNGVSWAVFLQLAMRTKYQVIIDYNPSAPFWAHDNLIGTGPDTNELSATVKLLISDHRHNTFLSAEQHRRIEGIKDPQLWRVYARGLTGNLVGLIYPNWTKILDEMFPTSEPIFGGLDFGYTNDPTALVKMCRLGNAIFIHEVCYESGLAAQQIKDLCKANGFDANRPIYCEHDPDMISQLRRLGGLNVLPARKGPGSILAGITKMKEYNVFYTASSINIHTERSRYMWIVNPDTGKPTNEPIDQWNHLLDAARYGVYTHYFRSGQ